MTDSQDHHRRSLRLKDYDYARAGTYFVTVCAQDRACLFGDIVDGAMRLNDAGRMVQTVWDDLPNHYAGMETDAFIVMPNHVHGIVVLVGAAPRGRPVFGQAQELGQAQGPAPTLSLPDVVHRFKTLTTKRYTDGVKRDGWPPFRSRVWQRNYYEHVIRDEASLHGIREYVLNNPLQWALDRENPVNVGAGLVPAQQPSGAPVGAGPCACPQSRQPRKQGQPQKHGQPQGVAPTAWGDV